jgi:hypothetical protein
MWSFRHSGEAETFDVLRQVFWSTQREQGPNVRDAKVGSEFAQLRRSLPGVFNPPAVGKT